METTCFLMSVMFTCPCASLLDEDVVLLLVIEQAEAVASAKCYQLPLRVQGEGSDHGGGLALDQAERLKARREQDRLLSHVEPSVALVRKEGQSKDAALASPLAQNEEVFAHYLPTKALLTLQQIHHFGFHRLLGCLVVELQHQDLRIKKHDTLKTKVTKVKQTKKACTPSQSRCRLHPRLCKVETKGLRL